LYLACFRIHQNFRRQGRFTRGRLRQGRKIKEIRGGAGRQIRAGTKANLRPAHKRDAPTREIEAYATPGRPSSLLLYCMRNRSQKFRGERGRVQVVSPPYKRRPGACRRKTGSQTFGLIIDPTTQVCGKKFAVDVNFLAVQPFAPGAHTMGRGANATAPRNRARPVKTEAESLAQLSRSPKPQKASVKSAASTWLAPFARRGRCEARARRMKKAGRYSRKYPNGRIGCPRRKQGADPGAERSAPNEVAKLPRLAAGTPRDRPAKTGTASNLTGKKRPTGYVLEVTQLTGAVLVGAIGDVTGSS